MIAVRQAVELLLESPSVRARFEDTGNVAARAALDLGLVGVVARAAGLATDARADFPGGLYRTAQIPVTIGEAGDTLSRALVRWLEIQRSATFVREILHSLPAGDTGAPGRTPLAPDTLAVTCVEGWRGEIWHVASTNKRGYLAHYKLVDPSFHNWPGLEWALRGEQIADFPLCNKSFNLSYCGFDL